MAGRWATRLGILVGAGLIALAAVAWIARRAARGPERILLVVVDTLRRDHVSAYGSSLASTPNMDALAARGQLFENAVASFHQTSMSMAALFTGRTPSIETGRPNETLPWNGATWCGMARFRAGNGDACIPRSLPTLAERLRAAGYSTIGVASNQFLYEPAGFARGFDDWREVDARSARARPPSSQEIAESLRARTWQNVQREVEQALARRRSDRFFLYVHYVDVHDYHLWGQPYVQAVETMDGAFGRLIAALDGAGLLEGAVVVLTSDHGERLGEAHGFPGETPNNFGHYGNPSWQEMLRIPLVVAPPVFADTKRLVRTQDLFGLVQEIAGLPPPPPADTREDELYVGELRYRTYREGRFKTAIRRADGRAFHYDLETDPDEQHDIAESQLERVQAHRHRVNELSGRLAGRAAPRRELSEEDRERLRVLGYLEPAE